VRALSLYDTVSLKARIWHDRQGDLPNLDPPAGILCALTAPSVFGPPSSYDRVMTQPHDAEKLPSPSAALLQLARLKADMSQRELAERAGVPVTMISAYERDLRQPTLTTLLRLLHAAGFDLRLHLAAYDTHDDILAELEAGRSESERQRRDRQLQAWRQATSAEDVA
jgi:transcriptional regulator with XRE-family HTH domain